MGRQVCLKMPAQLSSVQWVLIYRILDGLAMHA